MVAWVVSTNVVALVAVFSVQIVMHGCSAENYYASAARSYYSGWLPAKATWYGPPYGAGPEDNGGACGYKNVNQYPFMSMTSCGNEPLFLDGKGCGTCYEIRCTEDPSCSGQTKRVVITDMNYYPVAQYHFDLSGTAFGALAKSGLNDRLLHSGIIDIQFRRVPCNHQGMKVVFHVERGSNPNYLAVLVKYLNKDGNAVQVDLMESRSPYVWTGMSHSWGAIWRMDTSRCLQGPFSLRVRTESGNTLVANNVIPANWRPDADYYSNVQYY